MREVAGGVLIGGYRIERLLRRRSSSTLYSAAEETSGRRVALELIETGPGTSLERMGRAVEEFASIEHPNVLPVYEVGAWDDYVFVVTPLARTSLAAVIESRGRLDPDRVESIVDQVAAALDEMARHGIVFSALTPERLLLEQEDHVYLPAPFLQPGAEAGTPAEDEQFEPLLFMAPERIRGEAAATPRANVYELGAVAYTALTGHPPYGAAEARRQATAPAHRDALTAGRFVDLGSRWEGTLSRAMAVDPVLRFESSGELADSLRGGGVGGTLEALPTAAPEDESWLEDIEVDPLSPAHSAGPTRGAGRGGRRGSAIGGGGAAAPPPSPGESPAADPEPPRSAYACLEAPSSVVSQEPFEVVVGLSREHVENVYGDPLLVPEAVRGAYVLTVQVVGEGFTLAGEAESWRVEMAVTASRPYPTAVLRLLADTQDAPLRVTGLKATYSIGGQTVGLAVRPIAVLQSAAVSAPPAPVVKPGTVYPLPPGWKPPDLTVNILKGESRGRLLWTFETPHEGIALPTEKQTSDIGDTPEDFGRSLVRKMSAAEKEPGLFEEVTGLGNIVSDKVPAGLWEILAEVAERSDGDHPSVQLNSEEAHVPWELAVMDRPLRDDGPPFLGAQVRIGRWVLAPRKPKRPPPMSAEAGSMAVISGVYGQQPGWKRLPEAEAEAAELTGDYGAVDVAAEMDAVLKCLKGDPAADVLHFCVHGQCDPTGVQDGLVLTDGKALDPWRVKGVEFKAPVFVFLNACQVGQGYELLGDYAGLADAFLFAGAAGVIAPLWSIDDALSRELAIEFYERAFAGSVPADVLRERRAQFTEESAPTSSTFMAYQFFGHPDMRLERS